MFAPNLRIVNNILGTTLIIGGRGITVHGDDEARCVIFHAYRRGTASKGLNNAIVATLMPMSVRFAKVKYRQLCVVDVLLNHRALVIDRFGKSISMVRADHVRRKITLERLFNHTGLPFSVYVRVTIQTATARRPMHVLATSVQLFVEKLVAVKQQRLKRHEQSRGRFAFFTLAIIADYTAYFVMLVIRTIAL